MKERFNGLSSQTLSDKIRMNPQSLAHYQAPGKGNRLPRIFLLFLASTVPRTQWVLGMLSWTGYRKSTGMRTSEQQAAIREREEDTVKKEKEEEERNTVMSQKPYEESSKEERWQMLSNVTKIKYKKP